MSGSKYYEHITVISPEMRLSVAEYQTSTTSVSGKWLIFQNLTNNRTKVYVYVTELEEKNRVKITKKKKKVCRNYLHNINERLNDGEKFTKQTKS